MDVSKHRVDMQKSNEGTWYDMDGETRLLIARFNTPHYKEVLRENMKPFLETIRMGTFSSEDSEGVTVATLAEAVLLSWEGLKENGEDIPYSKEKAQELLGDPALYWFREAVEGFATNLENYYEVAEGNLKKSSAGS